MKAAPDLAEHLRAAMSRVDNWHAGEGGLLLSGEAHQALLDLRNAVKAITGQGLVSDALETATTHLWTCKTGCVGHCAPMSFCSLRRANLGLSVK
jgi:hypothetical protein